MPRGVTGKDGDTFVNANGYHHTRVDGKWCSTAHVIMQEKLGRPLDKETEMVRFADGDRYNLDPANIVLHTRPGKRSKEARIAQIEAKILDLQAELLELQRELDS